MSKFKIVDIQANPFRHIDRYPIRKDKVAALRESLRTTGFWDNVVARVNGDGKPQIAYGHHRLFALREEYAPSHEVKLIIRDLSDDQMLKIMARENMEEWGTSAAVEHETVRAVVEAYGAGLIELPKPDKTTSHNQLRFAPSFVMGDARDADRARPYTAQAVANYLAWQGDKVKYALGALELIEQGVLDESVFDDLGTAAARAVVEQSRAARRAAEGRAKREREQAAKAEREAAEAERRREAAEKDRQRRLAEAQRAQEAEAKRRAEREAAEAERRAAAAEREREEAEARRAAAAKREAEQRTAGNKQARKTGQHVSEGLKAGQGYANASRLADEVKSDDQRQQIPPHIDDAAFKLAAKINRILVPDFDDRATQLDGLLKFSQYMAASSRNELALVLSQVIERAEAYRAKFAVAEDDVIDAEIVEDDTPALSAVRN